MREIKAGDLVKIYLPHSSHRFGRVLYRYPRKEERHKLRIHRFGVTRPDTWHEMFVRRLTPRQAMNEALKLAK